MAWWFVFPLVFFGGFIFIVLLVAFVGWMLFSSRGTCGRTYTLRTDTAVQTLRERYAKGEITKEQFDQMSKDLGQH